MMKHDDTLSKELVLSRELLLASVNAPGHLEQKVIEVFALLRDPVFRYLLRVLDNQAEAEDLTQEVFLRLYTSLHEGQTVRNVRAWVFRVAHNLAIDRQKRKLLLNQLDGTVQTQTQDPSPDAEQRLLEEERNHRLTKALARLSKKESAWSFVLKDCPIKRLRISWRCVSQRW